MDVRKTVGANCAKFRHALGWTQEKLSEETGFSQQYISDLERGRRNPTVVSLYEFAQALDVEIIDFFRTQDLKSNRES